jgi:hypothetical protein
MDEQAAQPEWSSGTKKLVKRFFCVSFQSYLLNLLASYHYEQQSACHGLALMCSHTLFWADFGPTLVLLNPKHACQLLAVRVFVAA